MAGADSHACALSHSRSITDAGALANADDGATADRDADTNATRLAVADGDVLARAVTGNGADAPFSVRTRDDARGADRRPDRDEVLRPQQQRHPRPR